MKNETIKILILTTNPKNTNKLRLDEEVRRFRQHWSKEVIETSLR
jgi:hypothetical protein